MDGLSIQKFFEDALNEMEGRQSSNNSEPTSPFEYKKSHGRISDPSGKTMFSHEKISDPSGKTMFSHKDEIIHKEIIPFNEYKYTDLSKEFVYLLNSLKWITIDGIDHCDFVNENKYPFVLVDIMNISSKYLKELVEKNENVENVSISFSKVKCRYSNDKNNTILTYENVKANTMVLFFGNEVTVKTSRNNKSQESKIKNGDSIIIDSDIDNTIKVIREFNNVCLLVFLYYKITL